MKNFIELLLNKNPVLRNSGSPENLRAQSWFRYFNWEALATRSINPPYIHMGNNLTAEIENALKTDAPIEDIISKEEAADGRTDSTKRRPKNFSNNWDAEF